MNLTSKVRNTFFAVMASAGILNAQLPCGASAANERLRQSNPLETQQAANQLIQERNAMFAHPENRAAGTYIIPVVFHILHDYGVENINDLQVLDAMAILNRDYAKLNPDTTQIIPQFQSIASSTDIEFRLATLDPNGNCTNGIEHIYSQRTNNADDNSKINPWPRDEYLNIWVVRSLREPGIAGYAYYPSSVTGQGALVDGIIILHDFVGSIGTSGPTTSRALTHEVGHWLEISHTWGSTNDPGVACGDDGIPDTPITKGWSWCPVPANAKICDTAVIENYQNYMEYSFCTRMFTHDQALAMHATLNSNVSGRNNLWTTNNLVATGTFTGNPSSCAPVADFKANRLFVCQGGNITFTDCSWNGPVTLRTWTFTGGTPSVSTVAAPVVIYTTAGVYPVSLTVTNAAGSDSVTRTGYIYVGVPYAEAVAPVMENFDDPQALSHGWIVMNTNSDQLYWHETNVTTATGIDGAVVLDNYHNTGNDVDALITPLYDLRFLTGITMTFKTAFASQVQDTTLITERLRVFVSANCGQSWTQIATRPGAALLSGGLVPGYFIPALNDPSLWTTTTLNVSPSFAQAQVRFKFEWTGGRFGNEFYLDDINITGNGVGINETSTISYFDLFPNPSQDNSTIRFVSKEKENVVITLTDLDGRVVKEISNSEFAAGEHAIAFSTAELASGMYLISVNNGTTKQVKKLAVQH